MEFRVPGKAVLVIPYTHSLAKQVLLEKAPWLKELDSIFGIAPAEFPMKLFLPSEDDPERRTWQSVKVLVWTNDVGKILSGIDRLFEILNQAEQEGNEYHYTQNKHDGWLEKTKSFGDAWLFG